MEVATCHQRRVSRRGERRQRVASLLDPYRASGKRRQEYPFHQSRDETASLHSSCLRLRRVESDEGAPPEWKRGVSNSQAGLTPPELAS